MDINFKWEDYTFNLRVAALIRYENKILVEQNTDVDYYGLVGGRCKLGEDSITAIKREIKEETGEDTEYIRSVGIIENFFTSRYTNSPYHEILIIHELKFKNPKVYQKEMLINEEEPKKAKFYWKEIASLKKCKPEIAFRHLLDKEFFHIINKEEKYEQEWIILFFFLHI